MQTFFNVVATFGEEPSALIRDEIGSKIWETYGVTKAVLIIDMAGFSYTAQEYGFIHFLSMINSMQQHSKPIIESFSGEVIKYEADNCYCIFDKTADAIDAASALLTFFTAYNQQKEPSFAINLSFGIAHGEILLINGEELYGNSVNLASKLGEDIASAGEIFVETLSLGTLHDKKNYSYTSKSTLISNVEINYWSVVKVV